MAKIYIALDPHDENDAYTLRLLQHGNEMASALHEVLGICRSYDDSWMSVHPTTTRMIDEVRETIGDVLDRVEFR